MQKVLGLKHWILKIPGGLLVFKKVLIFQGIKVLCSKVKIMLNQKVLIRPRSEKS